MACYSILRFKKLKGAALGASDGHGGRLRETPNADPERRELNELLLGEDRELHEMIEVRVREEGLWRRANSVEVIEILLTATRAHFEDERGELVEERVREWERANVGWVDGKYGDLILKLKSHRDERTPHLTGYLIPAAERRAAERVEAAERDAREAQDALTRERVAREALEQANGELREMLLGVYQQSKAFEREALALGRRFANIPLVEVMGALGLKGEREGDATVYPARGRRMALSVSENRLYNREGQFLCEYSLDVVMLIQKVDRNQNFTEEQALGWLAGKFGEPRALAAYVVWSESRAGAHLELTRPEREERARQPLRIQRDEPERLTQEQGRDGDARPGRGLSR